MFDAGVSFYRVFLFRYSDGLGCIWGIDEKRWEQNMAFSYLKALSVSLDPSKCFISRVQKWLWEICCAELAELYSSQDVWLRGVEFPAFVLCLLCISYLNERSLLM